MKHQLARLILLTVTAVVGIGIACKNTATGPNTDLSNLVTNGTFEANSQRTWNGWVLRDTPLDTLTLFAQDAPPLGGSWSLKLQYNAPDIGYARWYLSSVSGFNSVYRITVWARANNDWPNGKVTLGKLAQGNSTVLKSKLTPATVWTQYTVEDTFDLATEDSLYVELSAGGDHFPPGDMRFDLVRLEKIR
jgi:hypothetical protein